MKKQLHILEGFIILIVVFIGFLISGKFIYHIRNEKMDTTYIWNITLNNLDIKEGSKGTVTYTENSLNVDVVLKEFNEFSEFNIDVCNNGTVEAILDDYMYYVDNPTNILTYKVTYDDGEEIKSGDSLLPGSKRTLKVKILYPPQEKKIYPALELKLSFSMHYIAKY